MKDINYLRKRLAEEVERAKQATCEEAEIVHRALASRYAQHVNIVTSDHH